ncbi:MAG: chemotaxis response regulator protein-glutamate methylesterase [Chroococcidiopsidaceae cyanobacterium CP_BM_RX_35]|nr:chemotaxis response regulator protein-glutamate methylesterase [Chroococcidiopsidaceae cyanobacterium CP_BM_RX_35]
MSKIRVLIVDDAVVVRSRVSKLLATDPALEVVGVAAHGRIALAKIPHVNPDVVILDVEMPEMNGLETLAAIRQQYPVLPVIMFSTATRIGATATLDALALGASDYATKPSQMNSIEAANQQICEELIPKIKFFGTQMSLSSHEDHAGARNENRSPTPVLMPSHKPIEVLGIGVSTGGPNALAALLPQFPTDFPVPILIVQHMPPVFTKLLAERLTAKCQLPVDEATNGTVLEPGHIWIGPGNFHMVVQPQGKRKQIIIYQAPPENSCRPSVNVLFRSLAQVYGSGVLVLVLTGMGQDGLHGCKCIREANGQILAQDQSSSVVWGMPGFVANAGLADQVLPLDQLADEVIRRVRHNSSLR